MAVISDRDVAESPLDDDSVAEVLFIISLIFDLLIYE